MRRSLDSRALLAVVALAFAGCGDDWGQRLPVHPADGKVVAADGSPVPKAIVRFHPKDPAAIKPPEGEEGPPILLTTETDDEGHFALSSYLANDGVPAGDYSVTVRVKTREEDVENGDGRPGQDARNPTDSEKLYANPATTPLAATVKPGENHFVFEMK